MKKIIYTLLLILALTSNLFAAGSSGDSDSGSVTKASNYTKAKNLIKWNPEINLEDGINSLINSIK